MKRFLVFGVLPLLLGLSIAEAQDFLGPTCTPHLIGPGDFSTVYSLGNGLYTTETQSVQCDNDNDANCVFGYRAMLVLLSQLFDEDGEPIIIEDPYPCTNFEVLCGLSEDLTVGPDISWGPYPSGDYEYTTYWQLQGCDDNGPVDVTSTYDFTID